MLKELAFFRRLLVSQKRELAQTSKRSVRGDRSKRTLEIRADIRKTGGVIADLRAEMRKREEDTPPGEESPSSVRRVERLSSKVEAPKQESGYAKPPPLQSFRPTSLPGFDPSRPPHVRSEYARGPAPPLQPPPTKKESTRPRPLPPTPSQGQPGR